MGAQAMVTNAAKYSVVAVVAAYEAAIAHQPGHGALDDPAIAAETLGRLDRCARCGQRCRRRRLRHAKSWRRKPCRHGPSLVDGAAGRADPKPLERRPAAAAGVVRPSC